MKPHQGRERGSEAKQDIANYEVIFSLCLRLPYPSRVASAWFEAMATKRGEGGYHRTANGPRLLATTDWSKC